MMLIHEFQVLELQIETIIIVNNPCYRSINNSALTFTFLQTWAKNLTIKCCQFSTVSFVSIGDMKAVVNMAIVAYNKYDTSGRKSVVTSGYGV